MRKNILRVTGLVFVTVLAAWPEISRASFEVTGTIRINATADFYAPLSPSGTWVDVGAYGRCWHPSGVAVGWRPYCDGTWVWTDCGWYWESAEPWAWACYHYGWWVSDPVIGWVWVPGIEWAPAWVSWRVGGGYIGWAPLPPKGVAVGVNAFAFVQTSRFAERVRPSAVTVNNTVVFNQTTLINNITKETRAIGEAGRHTVVINDGPGTEAIQKAKGGGLRVVPIQEAARRTPAPAHFVPASGASQGVAPHPPVEQSAPKPSPPPAVPQAPLPPPPAQQSPGEGGGEKGRDRDREVGPGEHGRGPHDAAREWREYPAGKEGKEA